MKGKFYPKELKSEVIDKIKSSGLPASQIADQYGINIKTVYAWLKSSTLGDPSALEINKLKREKKELLEIIGFLTLKLNRGKKNGGPKYV